MTYRYWRRRPHQYQNRLLHRAGPAWWAVVALAVAVAGTGAAPAAAQTPAQTPAGAASSWPPASTSDLVAGEDPLDCAVDDVDADPRHAVDDRCETWAAIYDDPDLYDNSLSTFNSSPDATDDGHRMVVSPTGEAVFTLGLSCRDPQGDRPECRWALVAHRADNGDELWVAHEETVYVPFSAEYVDPWLADLAVSADGARVYVTGHVRAYTRDGDWDPLTHAHVLTIAYDADSGRKLWERVYGVDPIGHRPDDHNDADHDLNAGAAGVALAVDPTSDRVYITGYADHRDTYYDVLVVAYDGVSGSRHWVTTDDTSTADHRYVNDRALPQLARVSPDGKTLYLAARAGSTPRLLAYTAHDRDDPAADGTQRWARGLPDTPHAVDLAPDGSRIYLRHGNRIAAYDADTGIQGWPSRPSFNSGDGTAADLAVDPTGERLYVTGRVPGSDGGDYGTVAYDAATGGQLWLARYDGSSAAAERSDAAAAVGVSPDGARVYVTGISITAGNGGSLSDAVTGRQVTVAYDAASGDQEPLWVAIYSRLLDNETVRFLAVGPEGTVFTAGTLADTGEGMLTKNISDWGVQAYAP